MQKKEKSRVYLAKLARKETQIELNAVRNLNGLMLVVELEPLG